MAPSETSFDRLQLAGPLRSALGQLGYAGPTPIQAEALPHLLAGRNLLGVAPTGTGKTAAYLLPVLQRLITSPASAGSPRALVVSPTRELAAQIGASAQQLLGHTELRTLVLHGGVAEGPQLHALGVGVDLLVATPGRLLDLLTRGLLSIQEVTVLVLDEADRLLDEGFLPDCRRLFEQLSRLEQTVVMSATLASAVRELAEAFLDDPVIVEVSDPGASLERIDQHVYYVAKADKHQLLAHVLTQGERALVFVRTRQGAERAVELLARRGHTALALHGDLSQAVRSEALEAFRRTEVNILLATDLAARGLHVDDLGLVINFDLPSEPETYVHRIGRTGRAGGSGTARSFCDPSEHRYLAHLEALCGRPLQPVLTHPFHDHDLIPGRSSGRKGRGRTGRHGRGRRR